MRFEHRAAGLDRWFEVYASRVGAAGSRIVAVVFNNVTERKQAVTALAEQARLLFTPRFIDAVHVHRAPGGERWRVDETYLTIDTRWRYRFRAIDEQGPIIDVYLSDRRDRAAAQRVFAGAIHMRGTEPTRVTTDTATCYPPALRTVLPLAQHQSSKYLNTG